MEHQNAALVTGGVPAHADGGPGPALDYPASLEWIRTNRAEVAAPEMSPGTEHVLIAVGHLAVAAGHRIRYVNAAELLPSCNFAHPPGLAMASDGLGQSGLGGRVRPSLGQAWAQVSARPRAAPSGTWLCPGTHPTGC